MKALAKYWKVLVALVLAIASVFVYFNKYELERLQYEKDIQQAEVLIAALERTIEENVKYAHVQDQLEDAKAEIEASRKALYEHFPVELKEEDQIMYVLYLETIFKEEIFFTFNEPAQLVPLSDGSSLMGLEIAVNYETTYEGFQKMINYLATDSRVVSVQAATIEYDAKKDIAAGYVILRLYLVDSQDMEYMPPDVAIPEIGKENIFD